MLLGIVEGLTEFLPVSSTAHLRISEALFHVSLTSGYWKMYTIVIQLGAILCLPVYFRERIAKLLATFPKGARGDRTFFTHPLSLVMVAFVVTAIPAFLLTKVIGKRVASGLDRGVPDSFGGVPGDLEVDVHDRSGAVGGNVARFGSGVFVFPFDTDDGGGNLLRPPEIPAREGRECNWSDAH